MKFQHQLMALVVIGFLSSASALNCTEDPNYKNAFGNNCSQILAKDFCAYKDSDSDHSKSCPITCALEGCGCYQNPTYKNGFNNNCSQIKEKGFCNYGDHATKCPRSCETTVNKNKCTMCFEDPKWTNAFGNDCAKVKDKGFCGWGDHMTVCAITCGNPDCKKKDTEKKDTDKPKSPKIPSSGSTVARNVALMSAGFIMLVH